MSSGLLNVRPFFKIKYDWKLYEIYRIFSERKYTMYQKAFILACILSTLALTCPSSVTNWTSSMTESVTGLTVSSFPSPNCPFIKLLFAMISDTWNLTLHVHLFCDNDNKYNLNYSWRDISQVILVSGTRRVKSLLKIVA